MPPPKRRTGRAAARRTSVASHTPQRFVITGSNNDDDDNEVEDDDVTMPDATMADVTMADGDVSEADADSTRDDDEAANESDVEHGDDADQDEGDEDEGEDVEQQADDGDRASSVKEPTPPPMPVRKKRVGRPPKIRQPGDVGSPRTDPDATPRRRGRGGWRGRGGRRGGPAPPKVTQAIDKEGTVVDIQDDECVLPEDPEGETKVDKLGYLQGGREYRCRTFTVHGRGDRLYMLSTEPARCVGFRDSYLFFTKHLRLFKIIANDEEKKDMIERDIIPHSYKGRAIGIVTARSVFREFGARIVVGGRTIIDDYAVADARLANTPEGVIADPTDTYVEGEPYNKNQYVAWHGASSVYHQAQPAQPAGPVKVESKKRRVNVNDTNWMLEHSREASRLTAIRRENLRGVYNIHTNIIHVPSHMQPTRAVFELVDPTRPVPTAEPIQETDDNDDDLIIVRHASEPPKFPPPDPKLTRNYLVVDTIYQHPRGGAASSVNGQRPAADDLLAPFSGLSAVSDEIRALLPDEQRDAFDRARAAEEEWALEWAEVKARADAARRPLVIDRTVQPYVVSMRDGA